MCGLFEFAWTFFRENMVPDVHVHVYTVPVVYGLCITYMYVFQYKLHVLNAWMLNYYVVYWLFSCLITMMLLLYTTCTCEGVTTTPKLFGIRCLLLIQVYFNSHQCI